MTKTGKIPKLNKLNPGPFIEIHPKDAQVMGIADQDQIEIRSRRGLAILPAVVTDRVRPGNCFAPFHWNDVFGKNLAINAVTNDAIDPLSFQPEFKYCAVSLVRAAETSNAETSAPQGEGIQSASHTNETFAHQKEEVYMAQIDTLANMLGIQPSSAMTLETHEKIYLAGFITSLRTEESRTTPGIPVLPPTAPLEPVKRFWLDGVLAGLFSRTYLPDAGFRPAQALPAATAEPEVSVATSAEPEKEKKQAVTIIWASQTGNAEGAAGDCMKKLQDSGYDVRLASMNEYSAADLSADRFVLVVASTFGAGDPPDNGESFWQALEAESAPRLPNLRYSVLAFGDSNYDLFCGFGRNVDARLEQLGAQRLIDRVDCDTDFQEQVDAWINTIDQALTAASQTAETAAAAEIAVKKEYTREQPLLTRVNSSRLLSHENSEKETRHHMFDLKDSGLEYEAGDALGVWPTNCPDLVEEILTATKLDPSASVTIKDRGEMTLAEALLRHLEIARITPPVLQFVKERSNSEVLENLLKKENESQLKKWLWGRQLTDLLHEFPLTISAEEFVKILKPLQPRLYSISSSPKANPDEVHITVSTVRYSHNGHSRKGVCSAFLADQVKPDTEIPIFVQKSTHFRPPADPDAPMIMVGPGTGVGPFRGFLQDRQAMGAKGKNWLIFGEQRAEYDFYFKEELEAMQKEGFLQRLDTAFSRDQKQKIYVQTRMLEHGAELWDWLKEGAYFFICGDASRMAKEVDSTLKKIVQEHGGMSADEAKAYVNEMLQSKRYARDVY